MGPDPLNGLKIPRLMLEQLGVYVCAGRQGWGVLTQVFSHWAHVCPVGRKEWDQTGGVGCGGRSGLLQAPKVLRVSYCV